MMSNDQCADLQFEMRFAGNFSAAGAVVRAQIPMVLCSILPASSRKNRNGPSASCRRRASRSRRVCSTSGKSQIRKIGIIFDPTPYATLMKNLPPPSRPNTAWKSSRSKPTSRMTPISVSQIGRINAAGAGAIVKMGRGRFDGDGRQEHQAARASSKMLRIAQHRRQSAVRPLATAIIGGRYRSYPASKTCRSSRMPSVPAGPAHRCDDRKFQRRASTGSNTAFATPMPAVTHLQEFGMIE